jgi:dihydrofolate reductase
MGRISAIVAATDNDVISKNGVIPWRMPADSAYLKKIVTGHPIIMGSGTYKFMKRAYPGCTNIVISNTMQASEALDAILVHSVEEALNLEEVKNSEESFIFGGQGIYDAAMPKTNRIYLTRIHANIDGDKFFKYSADKWHETSKDTHKKDADNPYDYDFIILERT